MLAQLTELIPGSDLWPQFTRNLSEQFEARLVNVVINQSPSIFLKGMSDSIIPIIVSHGEGKAEWQNEKDLHHNVASNLVALQYVNNYGQVTQTYPANPNGSSQGVTGLTTQDGRVTIMMPHPERCVLTKQFSWHPKDWSEESPWRQMFYNVRKWVG